MYNVCFCFRISLEGVYSTYPAIAGFPTTYQKAIDNQYNQLLLLLFQFFDYHLVVDFTFYKYRKN